MAARSPTSVHLVDKLEKLVHTYNLGTLSVEAFFEALKKLVAEMEEEKRRAAREGQPKMNSPSSTSSPDLSRS